MTANIGSKAIEVIIFNLNYFIKLFYLVSDRGWTFGLNIYLVIFGNKGNITEKYPGLPTLTQIPKNYQSIPIHTKVTIAYPSYQTHTQNY